MTGSSRAMRSTLLALFAATAIAGCSGAPARTGSSASPSVARSSATSAAATPAVTTTVSSGAAPPADGQPWQAPPADSVGRLRPGSDPSVLPADVLIADKKNDRLIVVDAHGRVRWQFPRPGDLAPGQTFKIPDDAFFSPDGRQIIATEEDDDVISVIDVATHRIVYRYGHPGHPGSAADFVNHPDDALLLPDGSVLTADIKNCRLLYIRSGQHRPARIFGQTMTACHHNPPARWGSPNGAFPMANGHYLVTEINGHWVDELTLSGSVVWSQVVPGVRYPSDSNEISPGQYLTVDYSNPGQVVEFDRSGAVTWRFSPSGPDALNHPSLGLPLPNGDVLVNDDYNHRVIVIDPHTDKIVWQYGHTGVAGSGPGYLDNPDGVDLVPPHSLLITHAQTMGRLPG